MANSKKRNAEEAFAQNEPISHKSKHRRNRKGRSRLPTTDGEMIDVLAETALGESTSKVPVVVEKRVLKRSRTQTKDMSLALAAVPLEPASKELSRLASKAKKKRKQGKDQMKQKVDHIGSHIVVKADAKKSPKKKTPSWKLSEPVAGVFINQDPILGDRGRYLILPTSDCVQIYSTKTSLLVRTLQISENDHVTSCLVEPSNPDILLVSKLSGVVQKWNWLTGKKLAQWNCQPDLWRIISILPKPGSPEQCTLLTVHGLKGEKSRLLRSVLAPNSSTPSEEVLLRSKTIHWSMCQSLDNGNIVLLCSGKQLTIGQLPPGPQSTNENEYTWREVTLPQPVTSMDVQLRDRPMTTGNSPVKMIDIVIGCADGVILLYENLLYRLIGREKGIKDSEILSRRLHWHRQAVNTVKWSRDGNYIVSGGNETVLVIWQLDTNQQQFLPHLSTAILNLTISAAGSSYALRLADNSVMVLSTADLLPSANISGLALSQRMEKSFAAALNPRNPNQLLLAIHADPLTGTQSSATSLQTFDILKARQDARQALAWNMVTAIKADPDGGRVIEPSVTHLKLSHDGSWLVTVDKWHPKPGDLDALHTAQHGQKDRHRSYEICLRFWKRQDDGSSWELVTRVDEPHLPVSKSILDIAVHPTKLEACTTGQDGMLRIWSPMARYRDGVPVQDAAGQSLHTWMCSRSVQLEPEPPSANVAAETSGALAYSEDGSVIAASWSWSAKPKRVVHFVNSRTAKLALTQGNIISPGPGQLAFSGRYLLALSRKFCIWDTVALRKTYSITLKHNARDGKFLAVNNQDNSFALAFDSRQPMVPSSFAVFDARDPHKGPLHQAKIHGHVKLLLPHLENSGYLIIDSDARIRSLLPPDAVRTSFPMMTTQPEDVTKGLIDIFGARPTTTAGDTNNGYVLPTTDENVETKSLDTVLSAITSSKLSSVRQMFEQVVSVFARKPGATA